MRADNVSEVTFSARGTTAQAHPAHANCIQIIQNKAIGSEEAIICEIWGSHELNMSTLVFCNIFPCTIQSWRLWDVPPKIYLPTTLHGFTTQKKNIEKLHPNPLEEKKKKLYHKPLGHCHTSFWNKALSPAKWISSWIEEYMYRKFLCILDVFLEYFLEIRSLVFSREV
jgi:hypothetical protein